MDFADAFDMAFAIKYDPSKMMKSHVPITALTDSLSLFDVITKATLPTEKRLMVDLQTVKELYKKGKLDNIWFIRSEFNPADALTKHKKDSFLETIIHPIEQWVTRS